jgi:hypothetical protein
VDRELKDSEVKGLTPDAQLTHASNAALQAATVALLASGFRVPKNARDHHYRTIQSLAHTIEADSSFVAHLTRFSTRRNKAQYEFAGSVSGPEAREMIELARRLRIQVMKWLREKHPELLRP